MSHYWHEVRGRQFVTAIEMQRNPVDACPDELWDDRTDGTTLWHIAYEALFFCDFHLSDDEMDFSPRDSGHRTLK
ncbi:MAG TPA: hypothetical protein VMY18_08700 [Acidobacteriota bacterium]|nr:hypothetical protein [Acidobacteriota bacterium]